MENNAEIDPWAKMGNVAGNKSGEVSQDGLAREAEWNNAMTDAPEFSGNQFGEATPATPESSSEVATEQSADKSPERDDNVADASAIINYGLNAAARERGVEATIQAINNFVYNGDGDPIKQLFIELGIDTGAEVKDLIEESRAAKPNEDAFRNENINAPNTINKSLEGALNAIKEVKELVAEVQSSPAYANLRAEAKKTGKGYFEYAVSKYGVRDLTVLFGSLGQLKEAPSSKSTPEATPESDKSNEAERSENETEENAGKNPPQETQSENQSSTINFSPDTDATARNKSLL